MTRWTAVVLHCAVYGHAALIPAQAADLPKPASPVATTSAEYRLGTQDVIDVFVWKEPELTTTVVVRPDGRISLPLADELTAKGRTVQQLEEDIKERLKRYLLDPVVNVMVKEINSQTISVLGEVRRPDVYRIADRLTVLDAIAMAGGFTDLARPGRTVVLRSDGKGSWMRIDFDIEEAISQKSRVALYLQPGDKIYVQGR